MSILRWRLICFLVLGVTAFGGVAEPRAKEATSGTVAAIGSTSLTFPAAVSHIAFSPNGNVLAAVGYNSTIMLWDSATGKDLLNLNGHEQYVNWIAFSPDGKTLASAGQDGTIRLWNVNNGKEVALLNGQGNVVASVAFSPDGRSLASVGYDRSLRLWEMATAKQILRHDNHQVQPSRVVFAPDGNVVATTNYLGEVILTDPLTGKPLRTLRGGSECLAFSPDGKTLASGGREDDDPARRRREINGLLRLWDPKAGVEVAAIKTGKGAISSVAFSPTGRAIATASGRNGVAMWDRLTAKELFRIQTRAYFSCVAISSDGRRLAAGDRSGNVYLWRLAPDKWDQRLQSPDLKGEQLAELWIDLAGDAPTAHRALWSLTASPQRSVKFLANHLKSSDVAMEDRIRGLIRDLDNHQFETREKATAELTRIAHRVEKEVRAALASSPSAEARKRLKSVLSAVDSTRSEHDPDTLRAIRAIHALELIGTPEACALLEKLANGTPAALETRHAKAALARLARQVKDEP